LSHFTDRIETTGLIGAQFKTPLLLLAQSGNIHHDGECPLLELERQIEAALSTLRETGTFETHGTIMRNV
jgi:hypothetical protein